MDISCPATRVLIFGSYFSVSCRQASRPSLSPVRKTMFKAAPLQIMSVSSCRAVPTLSDPLLPRSRRLGWAFLLSRLPPSASAVVAPLRQRNPATLHSSLATRLEHPRSLQAFQADVCPRRLLSSVTRAVELLLPT